MVGRTERKLGSPDDGTWTFAAIDDVVAMASWACGPPIAHIDSLDRHRQWFKAEVGVGCRERPAAAALCSPTLGEDEIFVVPDIAELPDAKAAVRARSTGSNSSSCRPWPAP